MRSSGWRKCPVWEWTQHNRSLLKSVPRQKPFPPRNVSAVGPTSAMICCAESTPRPGVDSAQQIIAEVGPTAETFPSAKCLSSWVGACPGDEESAGVNYSHRSPKGNRHMRRLLNQTAKDRKSVV